MFASKLVYNTNGWTSPTGLANPTPRSKNAVVLNNGKSFGFEEWLYDPLSIKLKLGYLDSFRSYERTEFYERIVLFTFDYCSKNVYYVGNLYGVTQLTLMDIDKIRVELQKEKWLAKNDKELNSIFMETNATKLYQRCYNSNMIFGDTVQSFVFNLRYEKLELFERKNWVNLTERNVDINSYWKRLSKLYQIGNDNEFIFIK